MDVSFDKSRVVLHLLMMYTHLAGYLSVYCYRMPPQRMHRCCCEASSLRMAWRIYVMEVEVCPNGLHAFAIHVDVVFPLSSPILIPNQLFVSTTDLYSHNAMDRKEY